MRIYMCVHLCVYTLQLSPNLNNIFLFIAVTEEISLSAHSTILILFLPAVRDLNFLLTHSFVWLIDPHKSKTSSNYLRIWDYGSYRRVHRGFWLRWQPWLLDSRPADFVFPTFLGDSLAFLLFFFFVNSSSPCNNYKKYIFARVFFFGISFFPLHSYFSVLTLYIKNYLVFFVSPRGTFSGICTFWL